ncbi:MAG: segregation and condensation protein A [Eubacteriales bacterium]|jgi:segregation and condensation protein A
MGALMYRLDRFEGPLDLLLTLLNKNKVNIEDIPISLICSQYLEYISGAEAMNMEIASEFLVMASELMLIKSRMLLPRPEPPEEDPRRELADALKRYREAKAAAKRLAERYAIFSGRMVKDTDEISVDKTFVADHDPELLRLALRRICAYLEAMEEASQTFTPMLGRRVISVESKIESILERMQKSGRSTLRELIGNEATRQDVITAFIAILELIRIRRLLIDEDINEDEDSGSVHGLDTTFILNTDESTVLSDERIVHEVY